MDDDDECNPEEESVRVGFRNRNGKRVISGDLGGQVGKKKVGGLGKIFSKGGGEVEIRNRP